LNHLPPAPGNALNAFPKDQLVVVSGNKQDNGGLSSTSG
jgi:hypothetical protein